MKHYSKVILGNGLSGKIFAFYNREFKIIGKEEPMIKNPLIGKLIFLQDNVYNRRFLEDLESALGEEISFVIKSLPIECFDGQKYSSEIKKESKEQIINKKLTSVSGEKLTFNPSIFNKKIALSEENNGILRIIEIDFNDLVAKLNKVISSQVVDASLITKILLKEKKIFTETSSCSYDLAINTINLNIFSKISGESFGELKTLDTTIIEGTEETFGIKKIPYSDAIIYFPQEEFEFSKIVKRDGKCYAEITGTSKKFLNGAESKGTRLIKKNISCNFKGLIFLGRYAEWDPDVKIQDVIRKASEKLPFQLIWTDQKAFSSLFFDFKEDLDLVQKNIKEQILLMSKESFDLLDLLNWKSHQNKKEIDFEKVKEEWIDVFKYWLTIGINLGITPEDFIKKYEEKSLKAREKFGGNTNGTK